MLIIDEEKGFFVLFNLFLQHVNSVIKILLKYSTFSFH